MRFYNSSPRDLMTDPFPDAPSITYDIYDGSSTGPILFRGPNLNVSAAHTFAWSSIVPWSGTVRADQAFSRFACDEPPGNVIPVGAGPLLDQWSWWNHRTDFAAFRAYRGGFENPFIWGGCVQDADTTTNPVAFRLLLNGIVTADSTVSGVTPLSFGLIDGQYQFELRRTAVIAGVSTQAESLTTFSASSTSSLDENPPALRSIHLLGKQLWQEVLDPAAANRLSFTVDPMPGFLDLNPTPPLFYTTLADGLTSVTVQQGTDGVTWRNVAVTTQGAGRYLTDEIDVDPTATTTWFRIGATDLAGNTLRYTFQVPRGTSYASTGSDANVPTTTILSPASGATIGGTVVVTAAASDDVGVTTVDLLVDGVKVATASAAPYTFTFDTGPLSLGAHQLRTRAHDAAGNVGYSASVNVQVGDSTAPTVSITTPAEGAFFGGSPLLRIILSATDNVGITHIDYLDGATLLASRDGQTPYLFDWDISTVAEGTHTLTARALDQRGNAATSTAVHVTIDRTAPNVTVTAPVVGARLTGAVLLQATATDNVALAGVTFYDNTTLLGTVAAPPFNWSWNTYPVADGVHGLTIRATDKAGNIKDGYVTVTVDNAVTPTLITPAPGALLGRVVAAAATTNNDAAVSALVFLDGATPIGTLTGAPFAVTWNPTVAGAHNLTARATDRQGRVTTSPPVSVTVDLTNPTAALTAPANGAIVSGTVQVTATATDGTAIARVEFYEGANLIGTDAVAPFAMAWNTATVATGAHTLKARAYDTVGNTADSASIAVTVSSDVTPPTVSISAPGQGAAITGTVLWTAVATDNVAVTRVELYDGATLIATLTSSPYTLNWNTATAAVGAHSLTARAFDAPGNSATSAAVNVTIDRTAPTVALSAPVAGATVSGTVTVAATASDNIGIARVEFYRDNTVLLASSSAAPYSISWDTTGTAAGSHPLKAIAFDTAGNATTSASVTVTVRDVTAPTVTITSPANAARVTVGSTVTIAASASDATGVSRVEFSVANVLTCTDTTAPYTCAWRVPAGTGRSYALVAKAFDAANNSRSSTTVTVTSQ